MHQESRFAGGQGYGSVDNNGGHYGGRPGQLQSMQHNSMVSLHGRPGNLQAMQQNSMVGLHSGNGGIGHSERVHSESGDSSDPENQGGPSSRAFSVEGLTHSYNKFRREHSARSVIGYKGKGSRQNSTTVPSSRASNRSSDRSRGSSARMKKPLWFAYVPLVLACGCVIITCATEQVLRKIVTTHLYNYRWFLFELLAIVTTFVSLGGVTVKWLYQKGPIAWDQLPIKGLVLMGFLDTVHSLGVTIATGILPGSLTVLLPQALIPCFMIVRHFYGGAEFSWQACPAKLIAGCAAIMAGVLVMVVPVVGIAENCITANRTRGELVWNLLILFLSLWPAAVSSVYRSNLLARQDVEIWLLNLYGGAIQVVFGILLGPLALRLQFAGAVDVTVRGHVVDFPSVSLFTNFHHGLKCLGGIDSDFFFDTCEQYGALVLNTELLLYMVSAAALQFSLYYVMAHAEKESLAHKSLLGAVIVATLFFQLPFSNDPFLNTTEYCFSPLLSAGALAVLAGLMICRHQEEEEIDTVDIWSQLIPAE
eukprot:gb/GEZN01005195.1/.p1 GENE.gb/GEZN01005195.1/~~gb/GEZN01005195.1/.p1  ORF type:complete len:535 (-),score=23.60 gb/GEZN01005195.1/:148-1752(-)